MTSNELKHKAKLKEWALTVQECRSSDKPVKQWCIENKIKVTIILLSFTDKGHSSLKKQSVEGKLSFKYQITKKTEAVIITTLEEGKAMLK